ncbi:MAG: hypothetical protein IJV20_02960, partial [Prevotella sp.]|nr:hypothetical protein [Prevotella sp.]
AERGAHGPVMAPGRNASRHQRNGCCHGHHRGPYPPASYPQRSFHAARIRHFQRMAKKKGAESLFIQEKAIIESL